jgi:histidyl-tRNA synthetase
MARNTLRAVRGMPDVLPPQSRAHFLVTQIFAQRAATHGFEPGHFPLVERASLFDHTAAPPARDGVLGKERRPSGAASALAKEMFRVSRLQMAVGNSGGSREGPEEADSAAGSDSSETLALRPEGTAGVMRAVLASTGNNLPLGGLKLSYSGPMFRYERPQRGRQRQFTQLGVEHISPARDPQPAWCADVESIAFAHDFLRTGLHITAGEVQLRLNTLGDADSAAAHGRALHDYLREHRGVLGAENRARLEEGSSLRVLDSLSRVEAGSEEHRVISQAPRAVDYLSAPSAEHFHAVREGLQNAGVPFVLDPHIVRGLDYYSDTVFEFVCGTKSGSGSGSGAAAGLGLGLGAQQATVLAGGRYDGLGSVISTVPGTQLRAVGWAAGLERLVAVSPLCAPILEGEPAPGEPRPVTVVAVDDAQGGSAVLQRALAVACGLREVNVRTLLRVSLAVGQQLQLAANGGSTHAIIIGPEELKAGVAKIKDLGTRQQSEVPMGSVVSQAAFENVRVNRDILLGPNMEL